jgi:hypothetical protein
MPKHFSYFTGKTKKFQHITAALAVLLVAVIGTYLLVGSHAATPYISATADNGTLGGSALRQSCSGSSDGNCVVFGSGSTSSSGARGRPTIVNNTLVSDQGTLLRGGTLWLVPEDPSQYNWAVSTPTDPDQDDCTSNPCGNPWPIFTQYHLNTVRLATEYGPVSSAAGVSAPLCLPESSSSCPASNNALTILESEVAQATANHMYAVIDLHWDSGAYDLPSAKIFWTAVANQFKNNTNVIFELLNEPVAWNPDNYTAQNIQDQETLYNIVHTEAPQTPVILLTFAVPMNGNNTSDSSPNMTSVAKQLTGVDWSNAAVGFHGYWVNYDTGEVDLKKSFPTIDTEFGLPCNQPATLAGGGSLSPMANPSYSSNPTGNDEYCVYDSTTPSQLDTYQSQVMNELGISWICWDCNSEPGNSIRLAYMEQAATTAGWWWPEDSQ